MRKRMKSYFIGALRERKKLANLTYLEVLIEISTYECYVATLKENEPAIFEVAACYNCKTNQFYV